MDSYYESIEITFAGLSEVGEYHEMKTRQRLSTEEICELAHELELGLNTDSAWQTLANMSQWT